MRVGGWLERQWRSSSCWAALPMGRARRRGSNISTPSLPRCWPDGAWPVMTALSKHVRDGQMPRKNPLTEGDKTLLKNWIAAGALWGVDAIDPLRYSTDTRAGNDWWSLQPVVRPVPPGVAKA